MVMDNVPCLPAPQWRNLRSTVPFELESLCVLGCCSEKEGLSILAILKDWAASLIVPQSLWQECDSHVSSVSSPSLWLLL